MKEESVSLDQGHIDLFTAMEADVNEGIIVEKKRDERYHLDRKKMMGPIDPYSADAFEMMSEEERIKCQKLWCLMTKAVPEKPTLKRTASMVTPVAVNPTPELSIVSAPANQDQLS
jgi:hypothetical protein